MTGICRGEELPAESEVKEFARENELNAVIWDSVKGLLLAVGDIKKKIGKTQAAAEKNSSGMVKKLADLQKKKAKCEAERLNGLIADLEAKLQEMEAIRDDETKAALEAVEQFAGATELDQKMVDALIEKVLIYDPRHVEIKWKFSDEVMKVVMGK